jgi:hypothetical protein
MVQKNEFFWKESPKSTKQPCLKAVLYHLMADWKQLTWKNLIGFAHF